MARIRTIKPEFWTSEQVVECSATARLLFVGLWTFCDDNGIHPASERRAKMEVFPGDDFTPKQVRGFIDELIRHDLLNEYEADGALFWQVNGFKKHQKIEKPTYRFPLPGDEQQAAKPPRHSTSGRRPVDEESASDLPRSGMESNGVESNGMEEQVSCPDSVSPDVQAAQFIWGLIHQMQPDRKSPNLTKWANTIRLMRQQDKRTDSDIRDLFRWCNQDEFWKTNILSPDKLRAKWDDLQLRRRNANQPQRSRSNSGRPTTNESLANLARAGGLRLSTDAPVSDEEAGHIQPRAIRLLGQGTE
jgi:hypothetical protein